MNELKEYLVITLAVVNIVSGTVATVKLISDMQDKKRKRRTPAKKKRRK